MTVRNIRAHQSRGLLPPPDVRARTGYYGPEHVARIELIRELQSEGFNLEQVWKPFDAEGRPEERWPEVREALERLRPLASEALVAVFQIAMGDAVEKAFGREMERSSGRGRR